MPKGRMLAKKICQDEKVAKLSLEATLLYTWCIPHLDQKGRAFGDVWTLKSYAPHVREINPKSIQRCIKEWTDVGLVYYYGNGNLKYLEFVGFTKNQKINHDREADSVIPSHDELMSNSGVTREQYNINQINTNQVNTSSQPGPFILFCSEVLSKWNRMCDDFPKLSKIKEITGTRREKLKTRYEDKTFRDFGAVMDALTQQSFCLGRNARKWKVSFDWIIENDTNYMKVLEFRYKDGGDSVPESMRRYIKT